MEVQAFLPDRRRGQNVRPERCVEAFPHFVRAGWTSLFPIIPDSGRGLSFSISEGHSDVAANRDLVGLATDSMEAEVASAQPKRRLQVLDKIGRALRELLGAQPEMFVQNAF